MDIDKVRVTNLRRLLAEAWDNSPAKLAAALGYTNGSFIVQMSGPNPIRAITERTARKFEKRLNLPEGWFDKQHAPGAAPTKVSDDSMLDVITVTLNASRELGVEMPTEKFAAVASLAYTYCRSVGRVDIEFIKALINLAK